MLLLYTEAVWQGAEEKGAEESATAERGPPADSDK